MEDSITFRIDKEAKTLYVIGRDIPLFIASTPQGYEIIHKTKRDEECI